jgi:aryl-alcohol dehydrogenase-like predicted oxidoreductase
MEMRKIGGLEVSVVGLGCNNFGMRIGEDETKAVVDTALDAGINLFDTADVYSNGTSETFLGRALGPRRDEVVIATKFRAQMSEIVDGKPQPIEGAQGGSPRWIAQAVEDSLRRLGTDRIDLYQMHGPDPDVPIEDTLDALHRLVEQGKVREVGCSNFSGEQIEEATKAATDRGISRFVSVQNHYSLLHRDPEREALPAAERHGLGFIPYFPLASGLLTGKYRQGEPLPEGTRLQLMSEFMPELAERFLNDDNWRIVVQLQEFCDERGRSLLELAMSWLATQPTVASIIAGATKPEQVHANVQAVGWKLDDDEVAQIDRLTLRAV